MATQYRSRRGHGVRSEMPRDNSVGEARRGRLEGRRAEPGLSLEHKRGGVRRPGRGVSLRNFRCDGRRSPPAQGGTGKFNQELVSALHAGVRVVDVTFARRRMRNLGARRQGGCKPGARVAQRRGFEAQLRFRAGKENPGSRYLTLLRLRHPRSRGGGSGNHASQSHRNDLKIRFGV